MATPGKPRHRYTYADYVALEEYSSTKHEFFDGEIYAMAGGSEEHSALAAKVLAALDQAIGNRDCRAHTSLVEITSDSSEEYDVGDKLAAYKTIPTLREVVLVSHRERRITVHRRDDENHWAMRVAMSGGSVVVESLGAQLVVDAIYRHSTIFSR